MRPGTEGTEYGKGCFHLRSPEEEPEEEAEGPEV